MCGYCEEKNVLDHIVRKDVNGTLQLKKLGGIYYYFYLRETPDFISGLDKLKRSLAQKRISFFFEVPHEIVLQRGMTILFEQGFDSPAY